MPVDAPRVHFADRAALREWLEANAASSTGIWAVYVKGPDRRLDYADIVEEVLCVGWVDSTAGTFDEREAMLYLSPRRPKSAWSGPNKERIERLTAAGQMREAGLAVVAAAKASGSWTALDEVEQLIEPADLQAALDAMPAARASWDAFPKSAKRALLDWIRQARTPPTREKRIARTVTEAAEGRRANQWVRKPAPPTP